MIHPKRTLLVLGGSTDQLFLIRTAQELALSVLCLDQDGESPGFAEAEESACVSTRDVPALIAFLEQRRAAGGTLAGVLTMGSDIPDVIAAVAAHFGLAGPSSECARLATDKFAMKQRFQECGVPIPWFAEVRSLAELRAHLAQRGRLVLKPVDRSGSRGVFVLDVKNAVKSEDGKSDPAELYQVSRGFSFSGRVQVEEYLEGPQISSEAILWDGRAVVPGFADRNYELAARFHPQVMENGGEVPSVFTGAERRALEQATVQAARALGIQRGSAKGDLVWTSEGPKVIEIAARLSGGDLCDSLVLFSSGVNYVRAAIRIALGEEPDWAELEPRVGHAQRHVANRYFFPEPGRLVALENADKVRAQPWVRKLKFNYRLGEMVPPTSSHAQRFGNFLVAATDREALARRIEWVYRTLRIVTRPESVAASA
ncbi:MAG: ATP-grasp domain-containing protein [Planctomycetes bacterium]|nr:ATP-grasp domain-containing protein [Planctomycetota bacterium]